MKMRKILLSLTAILLIAMLAACNDDKEESGEKEGETVTPVEVADITKGDLVIEKSFYGRAEPNKTSPIMVQMPGEIDSLEVEEGDEVKEDDLIAKLKTQAGIQNIRASKEGLIDRKSTRLNSSHVAISYAVFCVIKKRKSRRIKQLGRK